MTTIIKPLEWEDIGSGFSRARAPLFGNIRVEKYGARFNTCYSLPGYADTFAEGDFSTAEDAKAACEAEYQRRMLSALAPQAGDNAEEPVAWQPKYKQDVIDHHKSIGSGLWDYAMTVYPTKEMAENYGHGAHEVRPLYTHPCTSTPVVSPNAPDLEDNGGE
jgi:hypothetical protein